LPEEHGLHLKPHLPLLQPVLKAMHQKERVKQSPPPSLLPPQAF
jgi:hypothetical protein